MIERKKIERNPHVTPGHAKYLLGAGLLSWGAIEKCETGRQTFLFLEHQMLQNGPRMKIMHMFTRFSDFIGCFLGSLSIFVRILKLFETSEVVTLYAFAILATRTIGHAKFIQANQGWL